MGFHGDQPGSVALLPDGYRGAATPTAYEPCDILHGALHASMPLDDLDAMGCLHVDARGRLLVALEARLSLRAPLSIDRVQREVSLCIPTTLAGAHGCAT